ncbi:glucosylceramidase [Brachionus plicatilis]|uniref:Glucosylceramidase n=1 Tax=Brachionus plicatilis TaxID=10195 RepID=A0A3M7RXX9_BRAPC|nr:glucosylceramidase [Brachionus plicatilis]
MNFLKYFIAILALISQILSINIERTPCEKRLYSTLYSHVCVCNSTYCDTVDPVDFTNTDTFYQEYITSWSGLRLEKFKQKFDPEPAPDSQLNLTFSKSKEFQQIFGFGGAMTDASGFNIYSLSALTIQNLINSYFSKDGIEYNIIRVSVAGVDFSTRTYSYDDFAGDFNLSKFSLSKEDYEWKIPFIQSAIKTSPREVKLFASAWSAPPWMKTNNDYKGNGTLIGPVAGKYFQTWADYYVKFFDFYKKNGLHFWAMTAQNEPTDGYLYKFSFNSMGFTPETQSDFIAKNLGPSLRKNGFGDIKIMILDDQRLFLPGWAERVFSHNSQVSQYVQGIAVHWYLDSLVSPKVLELTHEKYADKFIFATEACHALGSFGPAVILGSFERAESYVRDIIEDLSHWVTGWTDWNIALDLKGGPNWANNFVDSPVIVNKTGDEFLKQPMFYAMGHFSKFVPEGSVRIELKSEGLKNMNLAHVAFKNDKNKQIILILLNKSSQSVKYSIGDGESGKFINAVLEAHSFRTIIWFY